jgi:hypothetical protein
VQKIVVSGNPITGFWFTGPFSGEDIAAKWAESFYDSNYDWWISDLESPSYDRAPIHLVTPIDNME